MRWRLNRAPNSVLALAVLVLVGAPCALGQQPPASAQKAPVVAAKPGTALSAAQSGKQAAKGAVPDSSADPMKTESAQLLKLATELKAEIDKTNQNVLSIAVIRKADEIEHMARGMKDKVRAASASNSDEEQGGRQR